MKVGVVVFPGSNCDHDAYHAFKHVLGVDTVFLWHKDSDLQGADVIVIPGGFSYGDYLRSGAIASFSPIMDAVRDHAGSGGLLLGICNGFQILQEAGLLPGALLRNRGLKFVCEHVYLRTENNRTPLTRSCASGQVLRVPVAHNDGSFFVGPEELAQLQANNQIVFRYCDSQGRRCEDSNPNGSVDDIAGVTNREGNVCGMMPHPERAAESVLGSADGLAVLKSLLETGSPLEVACPTSP